MKILCVEDGSVDLNTLEEPLRDNKVLVYRRGATPPYVLELNYDTKRKSCLNYVIKELKEIQTRISIKDREDCLNYVINRIKELGGEK